VQTTTSADSVNLQKNFYATVKWHALRYTATRVHIGSDASLFIDWLPKEGVYKESKYTVSKMLYHTDCWVGTVIVEFSRADRCAPNIRRLHKSKAYDNATPKV